VPALYFSSVQVNLGLRATMRIEQANVGPSVFIELGTFFFAEVACARRDAQVLPSLLGLYGERAMGSCLIALCRSAAPGCRSLPFRLMPARSSTKLMAPSLPAMQLLFGCHCRLARNLHQHPVPLAIVKLALTSAMRCHGCCV
jgi:hypothetical protein